MSYIIIKAGKQKVRSHVSLYETKEYISTTLVYGLPCKILGENINQFT